ncbi:ANK-REP-REGION domain-containing protein [Mycena sanguinolenta]|uniref:ANK-REP-REGION domain-containing protein n=1 Tax=Mycena sanguinolenta TaxID=230812 RepID=A0A8H6XNR0_9AGAR|nr:ANK-REP-REGION domain-containing protein [Mycena sanguinolenta]
MPRDLMYLGGHGGHGGPGNQQGVGGYGGAGEGPRLAIDNIVNATFNMAIGGKMMFQERDAILNWLSPINFLQRQADISQLREKGTGEWLLADPVFKEWESSSGGTLWCRGIPGAGKTVLVSMVVDYLCTQSKDQNIGVACIYLNHKEVDSQTPSRLLASLWRQFVDTDISPLAKNLYTQHQKKGTMPTLDEVFNILMARIMEFSKVFIIIDAIDEYPQAQRRILLKYLVNSVGHGVGETRRVSGTGCAGRGDGTLNSRTRQNPVPGPNSHGDLLRYYSELAKAINKSMGTHGDKKRPIAVIDDKEEGISSKKQRQ